MVVAAAAVAAIGVDACAFAFFRIIRGLDRKFKNDFHSTVFKLFV